MEAIKHQVIFFLLTLLCTSLFTGTAGAAEKAREITPEEARQVSQDGFLFGLPVVYINLMAEVGSNVPQPQGLRAPINQFAHYRSFPDASSREIVGINLDTLYSLAWIDVSAEPLVLSVPEMGDRYWIMMLLDVWNDVPSAPGSRTEGGKGGDFLIVGPDWKGQSPEGMPVHRISSNLGNVAGRTYSTGSPEDVAVVNALQDQYKLTPLSKWGTDYQPPAKVAVKSGIDVSTTIPAQVLGMSAEAFFNQLARLLASHPPRQADAPIMAQLARLGIEPGLEFKLSKLDTQTQKAINAGFADGKKKLDDYKDKMGEKINGWMVTLDVGRYGTKYAYRAAWTFYAVGGNLVEDALYPVAREDGDGQTLTGENNYTLTFNKEQIPPVNAFWSLTLYDTESFLVTNPINRYSLGSRDQMNYGEDGSLTLYIQQDSPGKDKEANWLPSTKGVIALALRLYAPKKQVAEGVWKPQPVMKVK
jgi:hypothetical protein